MWTEVTVEAKDADEFLGPCVCGKEGKVVGREHDGYVIFGVSCVSCGRTTMVNYYQVSYAVMKWNKMNEEHEPGKTIEQIAKEFNEKGENDIDDDSPVRLHLWLKRTHAIMDTIMSGYQTDLRCGCKSFDLSADKMAKIKEFRGVLNEKLYDMDKEAEGAKEEG